GLGNAEGFNGVRELARVLGGEVGATRPPVLQHWVAGGQLIGQTGKRIRPRLLFSVGISGAVQYTAGTTEARTRVAINRDPGAAIFETADIGLVADAHSLLPLLIDKLKQGQLRQLADDLCLAPTTADGLPPQSAGFGAKVKKLRENRNWQVADLARATGQTPEFIQQVEANQTTPPVSFLLELGRALEVDPGTFLHDQARSVIRNERAQAFIKRTRNYSYQTFTPGAENAHLRAFMVTIEPRQAHKPVAYKHAGEEFMYVLEGELQVALGDRIHHLKPGETLHFNSEIPHKLKSLSNIPTRCLHVLYTP
ncbi:MAG: FAD-binding protein, partial [Desulfobacterales bacterium]